MAKLVTLSTLTSTVCNACLQFSDVIKKNAMKNKRNHNFVRWFVIAICAYLIMLWCYVLWLLKRL